MEKKYRKYSAVMILCFLVGGFSIILYSLQAYSALMGHEVFGSLRDFGEGPSMRQNLNVSSIDEPSNFSSLSTRDRFMRINPVMLLLSPQLLMLLIVGIISMMSGIAIFNLVREKEIKTVKENITSVLLTPDERKILDEIKKSRGDITQSQIVIKTSLSKVKVHRVISRLEAKGIVKKHQYGLTNKIILEKDI